MTKISLVATCAVVIVAAATLAACSGGSSSLTSTVAPPMGHESGLRALSVQRIAALTTPHYQQHPIHRNTGKSWIHLEKTGKSKLLYIADWATNSVYVYDYPSGKKVGDITADMDYPYGECVDKKGDWYVANLESGTTLEFQHGGTSPINTYSTDGYAIGCSVDAKGDVAVTDFAGISLKYNSPGQICVWKSGKGSSTCYTAAGCYYMWPAGYDDKGNLIVEGELTGRFNVCELAAGARTMTTLSFNESIGFPGGTMWDGKYIALGDQGVGGIETGIYHATLSGSTLTSVGKAILEDDCYKSYTDVVQPFIVGAENTPVNHEQGNVVLGGNLWCTYEGHPQFTLWHYPKGGNPFKLIASPPVEPYGQVVSIGK